MFYGTALMALGMSIALLIVIVITLKNPYRCKTLSQRLQDAWETLQAVAQLSQQAHHTQPPASQHLLGLVLPHSRDVAAPQKLLLGHSSCPLHGHEILWQQTLLGMLFPGRQSQCFMLLATSHTGLTGANPGAEFRWRIPSQDHSQIWIPHFSAIFLVMPRL